jgi:hypothetical protein
MALVVVGHGTGTPLLHRQARLGTIESLDLAHMGFLGSRIFVATHRKILPVVSSVSKV